MEIPLVSVVIPCYNHGQYVAEAVASVFNSSYRNIEIILVDDGSNDISTIQELDRLASQYTETIRLIRQRNTGLPGARNRGIQSSTGEYILTLDADDLIHPSFIMKAVWHLNRKPNVGFVYCDTLLFGEQNRKWETEEFDMTALLHHNYVPATAVFRKKMWGTVQGYDEEMILGYEDWEFWIRCGLAGWQGLRLSETLFYYRKHGHSMLAESNLKHLEIVRNIRNKHKQVYNMSWHLRCGRYLIKKQVVRRLEPIIKIKQSLQSKMPNRLYRWLYKFKPHVYKGINNASIQITESMPVLEGKEIDSRKGIMIMLPWLQIGGVEQVFLDIVNHLPQDQFRVYLSTSLHDEHVWSDRFKPYVEEIIHLASFCKNDEEQALYLIQYMKDNRISVFHVSNSQFGYNMTPLIKKHVPEVSIIDTLHMEEPEKPWDYFRYSHRFDAFIDYRVVITKTLKGVLTDKFGVEPRKVKVIPNGISMRTNLDVQGKQHPAYLRVGFVGRFVAQKQPLLFVKIMKQVVEQHNSVQAVMIGNGPLWRDVEKLVRSEGLNDQIQLMGAQNNVRELLVNEIDVLVAPSEREGLPIVGLEAMAAKVPIVCSDVPGWNDLVISGVTGVLVAPDDIKGYTEAILELVRNESLRREIGEQAFRLIQRDYSANSMAEKYRQLYNN